MHAFPEDDKLYRWWIEKINNPKLKVEDPISVRRNYRVCDIHFAFEYRLVGRHGANIKADRIPMLHLSCDSEGMPTDDSGPSNVSSDLSISHRVHGVMPENDLTPLEPVHDSTSSLTETPLVEHELCPQSSISTVKSGIGRKGVYRQYVFALPSKRTLRKILTQIPLNIGINKTVMNCLKTNIKKMEALDTYCVILFDEIALEASLLYNRKNDVVDGFQDNGMHNRSPVLADKAMVFMARGIHKKWKQPLAYYLNYGGMKAEVIAKCLKDIIHETRSIGLNVVGTVCDQANANVKAICLLYQETNRECVLKGLDNKYFGFVMDDAEIVPLYDPPHLLKGIRNNLFEYNCKFKWRRNKVETASWNDIRLLYGLEETEDEFRMCSKITDVYVNNLKKK